MGESESSDSRWRQKTMTRRLFVSCGLLGTQLLGLGFAIGCGSQGLFHRPPLPFIPDKLQPGQPNPRVPLDGRAHINNPMPVPELDSEFLWQQIIDTVDDYFRIKSEQRVQKTSSQWLEGRVETFPEIGATMFEPWRKDAPPGFQRWQSTFQTIRRTAFVRVEPLANGYALTVEVMKELEDVDRSASSGEGAAAIRHDGGVVRSDSQLIGLPITLGWIRQENDTELEQRILREILGRITEVAPPKRRLLHHKP